MELYNKYRPKKLSEILGNDSAIDSIRSQIEHGEHVFLLTGIGGCGKTTTARAFAGDFLGADEMSIHEYNSSENRGIDTVREITEECRHAALGSGKTVYILDEMHQQTPAAQNALLKILEECPEWCYFFLCTTDPQKLVQPLLTRCPPVKLKGLDEDTMFKLLRRIAHEEGVQIDSEILKQIAAESNGSSRFAIKAMAKVLYLENDDARRAYIKEYGISDASEDAIELCRALIRTEGWEKYVDCMEKIKDDVSTNPEGVRRLVMSYATSVLKKSMNKTAVAMLQAFSNADTYRNGVSAIWVALLDFQDYLAQLG